MNMTKRDIADIILVWMAITFIIALLTSLVAVGAIIGMPKNEYATKSVAIIFQIIHFAALLCLNYVLLFKRSWILDAIFPNAQETEISIPAGLTSLISYGFWIRLIGIFTFLTSGIDFFSRLVMDLATHRKFVTGTYWMLQSGTALVSAILAVIVIWKADWIAQQVGKIGSSNKASEAIGGQEPPQPQR